MKITIMISTILSLCAISFLVYGNSAANFTVYAQSYLQTIKHRNLVIDLGNGVKTNAQLTYPAVGKGPYPGVLLIPGTGPVDMNETLGHIRIDNRTGQKIYPPTQPFWQISQYLSERGFAVLQYDKRGIGANLTILDSNVWGNATINDLIHDADKALDVLIQQPEVDDNKITLIGHSEGTTIAPRVAIDNPGKVDNIVLMGAVAQNVVREIGYFQGVTLPLLYAQQVLDHDHNGLLSVQEASKNPVFSTLSGNLTLRLTQNTTTANGTAKQLRPQYNTNNDTFVSINDELKPILIDNLKSLSVIIVTPGNKCSTHPCPIWARSQAALEPTLSRIGNVPPTTGILIQQGQNDSQTPIQQAFLLQQALIDKKHPDHTLITYPNLGHVFYPSSEWLTSLGPIQPYVLADLYAWLEAHSGFTHTPTSMPSSYSSLSNSTTK
ncbi:MAG: alpha/beta hydrolase family protein [Nitrososphaeraceae archaeon]